MKLIDLEDETIFIPNTKTNPDIREAVRILIMFWNKNMLGFGRVKSPALIRFSKLIKGKTCNFYICKTDDFSELYVNEENITVILITNTKSRFATAKQLQENKFNYAILLAVNENGKYTFYKINGGKQ